MSVSKTNCSESFSLGRVVATRGAEELVSPTEMLRALACHARGEWGDVALEDRKANEHALRNGGRILSVHGSVKGEFWIITESDRSVTTITAPEDY